MAQKPAGSETAAHNYYSPDQLIHAYEQMILIRRFEEKAGQLYGRGLVDGFCHLCIGQAVMVGV